MGAGAHRARRIVALGRGSSLARELNFPENLATLSASHGSSLEVKVLPPCLTRGELGEGIWLPRGGGAAQAEATRRSCQFNQSGNRRSGGGAGADFLAAVEEPRWPLFLTGSLLACLPSFPLSCISTGHSPGLLVSSQAGSRYSHLKGKKSLFFSVFFFG